MYNTAKTQQQSFNERIAHLAHEIYKGKISLADLFPRTAWYVKRYFNAPQARGNK